MNKEAPSSSNERSLDKLYCEVFASAEGIVALTDLMAKVKYGSPRLAFTAQGEVDPIGTAFENGKAHIVADIVNNMCKGGQNLLIGRILGVLNEVKPTGKANPSISKKESK